MVGRDDVGFAAFEGTSDTEETNDVAVIGVEELAGVGAVDSDLVDLGRVFTQVFDVAEDVAKAVLADKVSNISP